LWKLRGKTTHCANTRASPPGNIHDGDGPYNVDNKYLREPVVWCFCTNKQLSKTVSNLTHIPS